MANRYFRMTFTPHVLLITIWIICAHVCFGVIFVPHLTNGYTILVSQMALLGFAVSSLRISAFGRWALAAIAYFYFFYAVNAWPWFVNPSFAQGRLAVVFFISAVLHLTTVAVARVSPGLALRFNSRFRKASRVKASIETTPPLAQFTLRQLSLEVVGLSVTIALWKHHVVEQFTHMSTRMTTGQIVDTLMVVSLPGVLVLATHTGLTAVFQKRLFKTIMICLAMIGIVSVPWIAHRAITLGHFGYGRFGGPDMLYAMVVITALLSFAPLKFARLMDAQQAELFD